MLQLAVVCLASLAVAAHAADVAAADVGAVADNLGVSPGTAIGITFFAVAATIIGAAIPWMLSAYNTRNFKLLPVSRENNPVDFMLKPNTTAFMFAFAAGALVFGSLFHILPDGVSAFASIEQIGDKYANLAALAALVAGVLIFICLEYAVRFMSPEFQCPCHGLKHSCSCTDKAGCGCVQAESFIRVKSVSTLAFVAMTFHHIPEGIAFYIAITANASAGALLGLILLVHIIPEGVSIGAPAFVAFPDRPWMGVVYGTIAGLAHPLGALIGYAAFGSSQPSNVGLGIVYGLISGMLLTIGTKGLLPYARSLDTKDSVSSFGVALGAAFIFFTVAMFDVAGFAA